MEMPLLPKHGKLDCRDCFSNSDDINECGKWRIRNDPGAWGTSTPRYLVLGFSKGSTQADIYQNGEFDSVGFGGLETRRNLTNVLRAVGLLDSWEHVDSKICATEQEFHFASLVRCSLARLNDKKFAKTGNRTYETSGELIVKSFTEVPHYLENCSSKYLRVLPASVELVAMLGTDDRYIKKIKTLIRSLHPTSFRDVNAVSFMASGALWVHLTHPSRGNGHLSAWLKGDQSSTSGAKRNLAATTIRNSNLSRASR